MSKTEKKTIFKKRGNGVDGRIKDVLLLLVLAVALMIAAWQIFQGDEETDSVSVAASELEAKVIRLLEEMEGVGEANVIVCETEGGGKNVVVVCEGADNLMVVMNVRAAVAAALDTEEKAVKVYLKKE